MTIHRNDETLAAYLDRQLTADQTTEVERWLAEDPVACEKLAALAEQDALLRAAMVGAADTSLTGDLISLIDQAQAKYDTRRQARRWSYAFAAAVLALAVGLPASYYLGRQQVVAELASDQARENGLLAELNEAVSLALESQISGQAVVWESSDPGGQGKLEVIRTYKSISGLWCREYQVQATLVGHPHEEHSIACRAADAKWYRLVELLVPDGVERLKELQAFNQ